MNILTSTLPTKIKIHDKIYDINYDYRTIINILLALEDNDLLYEEKAFIMLKNIYKVDIPDEDIQEAIEKAIKFIDLGKTKEELPKQKRIRTFSYTKDASYIFSGINSTHHIDLEKEPDLHWWKFMALFMDMSPDCMFGELTYYRRRKAEGKLTKEEKEQYQKIKDLVELDEADVKTHSEARSKFMEKYRNNMKLKNKEV